MRNLIDTVRLEIRQVITRALEKAASNGEIPGADVGEINIEVPKEKANGDFSSNIAMQLTKKLKKSPIQIAEAIVNNIDTTGTYIERVEWAGLGFINFYLGNNWLFDILKIIQAEGRSYGRLDIGRGQKVMVEFVSANPIGPLHMGNARGGALGDCIANVLDAAGYHVTREFYINDAGNQIEKFGISLEARYIQLLNGEDAIEFPEDGYHGEDIIEHVKAYVEKNGDKLLGAEAKERRRELVECALPFYISRIKNALMDYGISFDVWFSEQSLYENGEIDKTLKILKEKGHTYEREGAIWFKASEFGTEKDEVLVRNNGVPTYFLTDIAYHRNKFIKRDFERVINLLGADHHGHVARMKAGLSAFDIDTHGLDVVLFQLVRLYRNGEIARMSKRTGKDISLTDLLEEIGEKSTGEIDIEKGRDALRFFFNMKVSGSHLDFDIDLAVRQSNDNPVYYVQYAHARTCNILKNLQNTGVEMPKVEEVDLTLLMAKEELELMKKLAEYPEEIRISAETLEPSRLTRYVLDVAAKLHSFYDACIVKCKDRNLMNARIILIDSTRIVIKNVLGVLSINAPEEM